MAQTWTKGPRGPGHLLYFRRRLAVPTPTPSPQPLVETGGVPGGGGWGGPPMEFQRFDQAYLRWPMERRKRYEAEIGAALLLLLKARR